jgi:hypothetical protein
MRRIVVVMGLAGTFALAGSSSAGAVGDPLRVRVCGDVIGFCAPMADVSVRALLGPDVGVLCSPGSAVRLPIGAGVAGLPYVDVAVCEP